MSRGGVMFREYRCERCGRVFMTNNLELTGRIVCWQTGTGGCATARPAGVGVGEHKEER